MPQMTNMDINFISLVKKGANKQKIQIYKSDDYEEPETQTESEELKGFFNVLKSFFTGNKTNITKSDKKPPVDFSSAVAVQALDNNLDNARWTLRTVINNILLDETITDKKAQIGVQIDAYKDFVLAELDRVGIKKFAEEFQAESIEKAGRKISESRLTNIKSVIASLQALVDEVESDNNEGGDVEVNKEELAKIVKTALDENLKPINDRLNKLEKEDNSSDDQPKGEVSKEDIASIVKSALTESLRPIEERLDLVEKARGISKASEETDESKNINKSEETFEGFFV